MNRPSSVRVEPLIDREELALARTNGQVRQLSTSKIPLRDRAGRVFGIAGIGLDITERKRAEERIRYSGVAR